MRKLTLAILIVSLVTSLVVLPALGQGEAQEKNDLMVSKDEALKVAQNWVTLIVHEHGGWGLTKAEQDFLKEKNKPIESVSKPPTDEQIEAMLERDGAAKERPVAPEKLPPTDEEIEAMLENNGALKASPIESVKAPPTDEEMEAQAAERVRIKEATDLQMQESIDAKQNAGVVSIQEFKRGDRVIGYYCEVEPKGWIIVSLYRCLAPISMYSEEGSIDIDTDDNIVDLLKGRIEASIDMFNQKDNCLELAVAEEPDTMWEKLDREIESFSSNLESGQMAMNYSEGKELISTHWHQGPVFNNFCRDDGCSWDKVCDFDTDPHCQNGNTAAGCTAIAGAQIMKYWNWPPYKDGDQDFTWDWVNMIDWYQWNETYGEFQDNFLNGNPVSDDQINAVAKLCSDVGEVVDMDYDCDKSYACFSSCGGLHGEDLLDAFEDHFHFDDDADDPERKNYSNDDWWNLIVGELNLGRPVPYRIDPLMGGKHSEIIDGWKIVGSNKQLHEKVGNYPPMGIWSDYNSAFYPPADTQKCIANLHPEPALEGMVQSQTYPKESFPYRYVDRDASGSSATFSAGQKIQFLQGTTLICNGASPVKFYGATSNNSYLYTRGDTSKGIIINSGAIRLASNGSIKLP